MTHVEGRVDPVADAETIETELMIADLESVERRLTGLQRKVRGGDKEAVQHERLLKAAQAALEAGRPARSVEVDAEDARAWAGLQLLTTKPILYVCNVGEDEAAAGNALSAAVAEMAEAQGAATVVISAAIEEEIAQLAPEDAAEFLEGLGTGGARARSPHPRGLRPAGPADLLHRGPEGGARLDRPARHGGAAGRRRDPWRFRAQVHPRRDHRLRTISSRWAASSRPRRRGACAPRARPTS